jgi:hypothetical protein
LVVELVDAFPEGGGDRVGGGVGGGHLGEWGVGSGEWGVGSGEWGDRGSGAIEGMGGWGDEGQQNRSKIFPFPFRPSPFAFRPSPFALPLSPFASLRLILQSLKQTHP